ncbi:DUF2490 domain-containing protein [Pedobacter gandavensis]|uniref:DUF2490 domain-containing protein n=1 Tax=Pedobacter gandavensis TaxID=2679963 RepID=A0ABR6EYX3_9SPHI|nr:DUF2490 domain-containing protein [Pedobacter gandavensis]MBB2150386.1 DUF2490 domain-containing protein [Pedobacter gandavensis]
MRIYFLLLAVMCLFSTLAIAQTSNQSTGWLFLMNNNKLSKKWGTHLDVQLRTGDQFSHLRNVMFRPGLTYFINDKSDVTLGYLWNQTYIPVANASDIQLTEHRIWQQYIYKHKINVFNLSHRFRLEQRFIEQQQGDDLFAQRLRYFARVMLPLAKGQTNFQKGAFAALQNELMFNVQHKGNINGHFFDQNRAYLAGGYRFSKKLDLEAGYLNQFQKMRNGQSINHVIQLALYTRF